MKFVLVHGSWHKGSAWRWVSESLVEQGHTVYAPDGPDRETGPVSELTFDDYVSVFENYLYDQNLDDFVLVGHSFGGAVIAKLAERLPERIGRLVFLSAIIPRDGHSVLDEMPPDYASGFETLAKESVDNTVFPGWPIWREAFIGDADEETAKRAFAELVHEPFRPVTEKLDMSVFYKLELPKSYIHCTEDIVFPPGEWGWFPRMYNRLGLCRLVLTQGGHEMMFSNPSGLAQAIIKAGRP